MSTSDIASKQPVVIITGASGALGSAIATAYASIGAKLILQDIPEAKIALENLTATLQKEYNQSTITPTFINIRTHPKDLIDFTITTYQYITILINNAGFLRDVTFTKQTQQQWDDIIDIHLTVPYKLTKAVWPFFQQQKFGRILFISSHAGLLGNIGQSNYSTAKSALLGLTKTLSIEGLKSNIVVNAITPFAQSNMTNGVFPPALLESFKPSAIAPVVVYLTSHQNNNKITGEIIQCGGGFISRTITYTPNGIVFNTAPNVTLQEQLKDIDTNWDKLNDFNSLQSSNGNDIGLFSTTNASTIFGHMLSKVQNGPTSTTTSTTSSTQNSTTSSKPTSSTSISKSQSQSSSSSSSTTTTPSTTLKSDLLIKGLQPHIDAAIVKEAGVVIGFEISPGSPQAKGKPGSKSTSSSTTTPSSPPRQVTIDLKNGNGSVIWDELKSSDGKKPDAVLIIHDELFLKLFLQEVQAQSLYLTGKIKVRGDIAKALKFETVLKSFEHKVNVKELVNAYEAKL